MPVGTTDNLDVIRATARLLVQGSVLMENVFYYQLQSAASYPDSTVTAGISAKLVTMYGRIDDDMSEGADFYDILMFNVTQNRPMINGSWGALAEGFETSEIAPNGVAALITANTGYSRSRPKKYFGGFTEANLYGNAWSGDILAHLGYVLTDWLAYIVVSGSDILVSGTWSEKYSSFRPLISAIVRSAVAYMRKRKPGIGV